MESYRRLTLRHARQSYNLEKTGPLAALDRLFSPIIIAANKARHARYSLPTGVWNAVPAVIQKPVEEIFAAAEACERFVGALEAGAIEESTAVPTRRA